MGIKTMNFKNREGDRIDVTFKGDGVGYGSLTPSPSPVILQMDGGGGEYKAVKYTTASISFLCDGLQNMDLFPADPLAVTVQIVNKGTNEILFSGYASPNVFNQSVSGINDTLTIECVDCLGISKFIPYKRIDDAKGFQCATMAKILKHIAELVGVEKVLLPYSFIIENGDASQKTSNYALLTVSEEYFFNSTLPKLVGEGEVSIQAQAMTCFEVLEMLASSFRATFLQISKDVFLIDKLAVASGEMVSYLDVVNNSSLSIGKNIQLAEEVFSGNSLSVGLLPRYSQFSLQNESERELLFISSIFDDEYLMLDGEKTVYTYDENTENERVIFAQPLKSIVYDTFGDAKFYSYVEVSSPYAFSNFWRTAEWGDGKEWQNYLRIESPKNDSQNCVLSKKTSFRNAYPARDTLGVKISIEAAFSWNRDALYPFEITKDGYCSLMCRLISRAGSTAYFYDSKEEKWKTTSTFLRMYFRKGVEWRSEFFLFNSDDTPGFVIPGMSRYPTKEIVAIGIPGDTIEFEIWGHNHVGNYDQSSWATAYIKKLDLAIVPLPDVAAANVREKIPKIEYKGVYSFDNVAEMVTFPININSVLSNRYFGTKIGNIDYMSSRSPQEEIVDSGRWECRLLSKPTSATTTLTMLERLALMGNFGDGYEWELPLIDTNNNSFTPVTVVTSSQWQGNKVVVAISKDLAESTATVTLN